MIFRKLMERNTMASGFCFWGRWKLQGAAVSVRKMAVFKEIDCPKCGAKESIEVIERDNLTTGDSICDQCGFTIPEGVVLERYLDELKQK